MYLPYSDRGLVSMRRSLCSAAVRGERRSAEARHTSLPFCPLNLATFSLSGVVEYVRVAYGRKHEAEARVACRVAAATERPTSMAADPRICRGRGGGVCVRVCGRHASKVEVSSGSAGLICNKAKSFPGSSRVPRRMCQPPARERSSDRKGPRSGQAGAGRRHPRPPSSHPRFTCLAVTDRLGAGRRGTMPVSADTERRLLNHYKLANLYPDTWPHHASADDNAAWSSSDDGSDDDDGDDGDDAPPPTGARWTHVRRPSQPHKRRYRSLGRPASSRSAAAALGPDSVVQSDEADPLGMLPSVASELRARGVRVDEDVRLRNRFLLSSTSFSPALFLANVHREASTPDLLRGLDFLAQSIEQKSASLKVLVESNFERFVRAKSVIDGVYGEMRMQGRADPGPPPSTQGTSGLASPGGRARPHSRHASRNSNAHFRTASSTGSPFSPALGPPKPVAAGATKNALTRESEYGTLGLKLPLQDLAIKAEELWGPALGGREKEETLRGILATMEAHREVFAWPGQMGEAVRMRDYDTVVECWKKVRRAADHARSLAQQRHRGELSDADARAILVTAKSYADVQAQVEDFKRDIWRRLKTSHARPKARVDEVEQQEHLHLIAVLLQLGVDENPIWEWLHSRCLHLKDRIARSFERSRIEFEILRRCLASAAESSDPKRLAKYLRGEGNEIDSPPILAFWEKLFGSLRALLDPQTGLLSEVLEFWETTNSFIAGTGQKALPNSVFALSTQPGHGYDHLSLDAEEAANLRSGALELVNLVRENTLAIFADAPVEDLSELYSPIPPTPVTPADGGDGKTPASAGSTRAFTFGNVPGLAADGRLPPSPAKNGEVWEKFAFWPPGANAVSGSRYLSRCLGVVGTAAGELAGFSIVRQSSGSSNGTIEPLRSLVAVCRERCLHILCSAWTADSERIRWRETWTRSKERKDLTLLPSIFQTWEERVLQGLQGIAYVSEGASGRGSGQVVVPPPAKLLQVVRGSFVAGLYKVLSGMVEAAEKGTGVVGGREGDGAVVVVRGELWRGGVGGMEGGIDASDRVSRHHTCNDDRPFMLTVHATQNLRLLTTLQNLTHLRTSTIPHLISLFESTFSLTLTDESSTIRDVLSQIDARLFQAYVKPSIDRLSIIIHDGIASPSWLPADADAKPENAKPYVYDALLHLVTVHAEIASASSTSASGPSLLAQQILSHLLETSSGLLLDSFSAAHSHYSLAALMQATLDVEFFAQTLNPFTTERASEVQGQIYLALDERTDDEARKRLQECLGEMRGVLKRLREGTRGEFGCFRRERRGRAGESGRGRGREG